MTTQMKPVTGKIVVVDPIPFRGGSKVATEVLLDESAKRMPEMTFHVLTQDPASWTHCRHHKLWVPPFLKGRESGLGYLLKQGWQTMVILWLVWRLGEVKCLLAASGPGVDLGCYWAARLLRCRVVQLIHGPVGCSGLSARALQRASFVFYLESTRSSLAALLARLGETDFPSHWQPFTNGLSEIDWPKATLGCSRILWAASLLRWKGLETMLAAHQMISDVRPTLMVCYLQPKGTLQPSSQPQPQLPDTHWYANPANLDEIRSQCGIFVSTSHQEPFGLSILEAMAAGLCVVIPADGAWWDRHLTDDVDCRKYQPNDPSDLARVLVSLNAMPDVVKRLGHHARQHAKAHYNAADTYQSTLEQLEGLLR
ncbi:glycosyltransferase family 4 protein [Aeromonas piscicola]|jgi:glycosyltransferase involved in cell wall biosynthesis|uniref:Glycosyltransferase family 4 protein n=1 Tax=Aeromonas piscicola TaxID=600645 RepID=A0ABT7Q6J9_9GAMM|nr:glycosyltransferase family 4 protein [Aeromonas piscicola]MDM5129552.1 glycosyltransferase family 4 protein [Aeromonas piscicola]